MIIEALKKHPMTLVNLVDHIAEEYPDHEAYKLFTAYSAEDLDDMLCSFRDTYLEGVWYEHLELLGEQLDELRQRLIVTPKQTSPSEAAHQARMTVLEKLNS